MPPRANWKGSAHSDSELVDLRLEQKPRQLGPYKRHELLTGEICYAARFYTGYGDGRSNKVADYNTP